MGICVQDILTTLNSWAAPELAADWDNNGLQLGNVTNEVQSILIALEIDCHVLAELRANPVDLVITHHPLIFKALKTIDTSTDIGQIIQLLFTKNINHIAAHTNLDAAEGGVNDTLIEHFGLSATAGTSFPDGFGKYFTLNNELEFSQLTQAFKSQIQGSSSTRPVTKLAVCAGSGKSLISQLPHYNIDTFITGEIGYHDHVFCEFHDIRVILLGHRESEIPILDVIQNKIRAAFPSLSTHTYS